MKDQVANDRVWCEQCGLAYDVDRWGNPATDSPYTCDDCGGYVGPEVPEPDKGRS